jgi:hypothetical protein
MHHHHVNPEGNRCRHVRGGRFAKNDRVDTRFEGGGHQETVIVIETNVQIGLHREQRNPLPGTASVRGKIEVDGLAGKGEHAHDAGGRAEDGSLRVQTPGPEKGHHDQRQDVKQPGVALVDYVVLHEP